MKYVTIAQNYFANSRYTIMYQCFVSTNCSPSVSLSLPQSLPLTLVAPLSLYPSQKINTLIAFHFFSHARGGAAITIHSNVYTCVYACATSILYIIVSTGLEQRALR